MKLFIVFSLFTALSISQVISRDRTYTYETMRLLEESTNKSVSNTTAKVVVREDSDEG